VFTDTHCHLTLLDLAPYGGDLDLALEQARKAGVSRFMSISVDLDDHIQLAAIAARHADVGYSVGVHPCEDPATMARATTDYLVELAQPEKVWALGETGLDYFHSTDFIQEQKECFARHIHASQIDRPTAFCTALRKIGKPQKPCWIAAITFLFQALCPLKMRKTCVMLPSRCRWTVC